MSKTESQKPSSVVGFNAITASHEQALARIHQKNRLPYEIGRGLNSVNKADGIRVLGYNENLPTFKGKNIQALVEEKLQSSQAKVSLMDIGYGRGIFLLDMAGSYPDLNLVGFGKNDFAKVENAELALTPTYPELSQKTELVDGELPSMSNVASNSQDIITINNVFQYLNGQEARVASIKEAFRVLKKGGVLLVSRIDLEEEVIKNLMLSLGIDANNYEIANSDDRDIQTTLVLTK